MTRDEAYKIANDHHNCCHSAETRGSRDVDLLVKLGLLKLDEPKTFEQRKFAALKATFGIFASEREMAYLDENMAARGLKIVEADK